MSLAGVLSVKKNHAKISLQMVSPDGLSKTHTYGVYMATKHYPISMETVWLEPRMVIRLKKIELFFHFSQKTPVRRNINTL